MKPSGLHYTVIYITTGCNVLRDKEIVSCGNERRGIRRRRKVVSTTAELLLLFYFILLALL
jgi:hypothetical protein